MTDFIAALADLILPELVGGYAPEYVDIPSDREGYPFPLKITIQQYEPGSNEAKPLSEEDVVPVMQQLCRFSTLYWKSVSRQWLPVTLRYPEMLAQIAPHFKYKDWGELGNDSLWFL